MTGIRPLGDRVVIKKAEMEEKTQGGLILTSAAKEKPQMAEVVAVGPGTKDEPMELKVGDRVAEGDVLCKIETDKAVTDVESTVNGTLCEIVAQEGDTVEITKTIAWVEVDG